MKTEKIIQLFIALFLLSAVYSCASDGSKGGNILGGIFSNSSAEVAPEKIQKVLDAKYANLVGGLDSLKEKDKIQNVSYQVVNAYNKNNNAAIWAKDEGFKVAAQQLIAALEALEKDGIHPERYKIAALKTYANTTKVGEDSLASWDIAFTHAYLQAAHDLTFGVLNPAEIDKEWHADNDTVFNAVDTLIKIANTENANIDLAAYRPVNPRYDLLIKELEKWKTLKNDSVYLQHKATVNSGNVDAVKAIIAKEITVVSDTALIKSYQYLNHISPSGKIDEATLAALKAAPEERIAKVKLNLERLRWLPNHQPDQYIWVTIPQAEIDYYRNHDNLFHNRTIVGTKITRTPTIMKPMQNIVVCPPWTLPFSIIEKELKGRIPRMYEVFGASGQKLPNSVVNLSNYKRYTVRQPAGPRAALGYLKFNLPNKWDIYLHDTPGRYAFANKNRYLSHGCVRVKDPRVLASIILEDKGVTIDSLNTMIAKNRTKQIATAKIPVYIAYMTNGVDSSFTNVLYLNDVYGKDAALASKM